MLFDWRSVSLLWVEHTWIKCWYNVFGTKDLLSIPVPLLTGKMKLQMIFLEAKNPPKKNKNRKACDFHY